jgi:hypothetical protein
VYVFFRLCAFDPHELFEQIDASGREHVIEMKSRLAKTLPSSTSSNELLTKETEQSVLNTECVSQFVASLLDEYDALNRICQKISVAVAQLVSFWFCFVLKIEILIFQHMNCVRRCSVLRN